MGMRSEVQLAPASIGYVRVELGGREIGVAEHLLDAAQVGAALEQMRRERVAEQVRMHALRLEPGLLGEAAQDQEGAGAGERPAARVQEELGPVAAVEVGPAHRDVAAQRVDRGPAERHEALLRALPERADEPSSRSTERRWSPIASLTRSPAPYISSTSARSRIARGVVPLAASIRRSASAGESVRGSVRARRGSWSAAAGLSSRAPSSSWWRKKERTAATRRAMVVAARPAARISASQRSSSSVVVSPTGPCRHAESCARSRR